MSGEADVLLRVEVSLDGGLSAMALNPDDPRAVMLADFIKGDVQSDNTMARILLDELGTVERGQARREEITGNAFTVTIDPEGILIENAVPGFEDYPSYLYRHDEFRHALEQVLTILEQRRRTGNAGRFHSRPKLDDPRSGRMTRLVQPPDKMGFYTGRVELMDPRTGKVTTNKKFCTFYPDNLSREQILNAIRDAFHHSGQTRDGNFRGDSGLGFEIQGWYRNRTINSAFPIREENQIGSEADVLLRVGISLRGRLSAMALNPDDPRAVMLAHFIDGDVQAAGEMAREYLDDLGRVERGEVRREEITGNAFSVTIDPEGVLIENAVPGFEDWPSYRYRNGEFRHALEQVLTVLEQRRRTGKSAAA